jgi:hypothetical protein
LTGAIVAGVGRFARHRLATSAALGLLLAGTVLSGCSRSPAAPTSAGPAEATYGGLPSYLPSAAVRPDSVLVGTASRPALTTEGDGVQVRLADASVLASVDGPVVPGEGLPFQTPATTCTWTVTLSAASAAVPITIADFTTLDHLGVVYHPALVPGQAPPPATIAPHQKITFELRTVMPTGEGLLRWAPGQQLVASWDFEVEND